MLVELKKQKLMLSTTEHIHALQEKVDEAERQGKPQFYFFDDVAVMEWYLYASPQLLEDRQRTERTTMAYRRELMQFLTYMKDYQQDMGLDVEWKSDSFFRSLAPRHLREYQKWLMEKSPYTKKKAYSIATLTRKTTILKSFFHFLYKNQYIEQPLHDGLKSISVTNQDRPNRDMTTKDVVRVLDAFIKTKNIFAFTIIQLLVATGIRNEELCTLQIQSIKKNIHGDDYLEIIGKGNKRRDVPLRAAVRQSISYYRQARGVPPIEEAEANSPLLPTGKGKAFSPSFLTQTLHKELAKIDHLVPFDVKRVTPHVFRHAFAIISHENKVNVYDIMRSLGHEKLDTTMIYLEKIFAQEQHASHQWTNDIQDYL